LKGIRELQKIERAYGHDEPKRGSHANKPGFSRKQTAPAGLSSGATRAAGRGLRTSGSKRQQAGNPAGAISGGTAAGEGGQGRPCHLGIQKTLSGMAGKTESNQGRKNRL